MCDSDGFVLMGGHSFPDGMRIVRCDQCNKFKNDEDMHTRVYQLAQRGLALTTFEEREKRRREREAF